MNAFRVLRGLCVSALILQSFPVQAAKVAGQETVHPALKSEAASQPAFADNTLPARLRVLVALGPSTYFLKDGAPHGIEHAMLSGFERQLNLRVPKGQPPVRLQLIPVEAGELIPALLAGRGDVAAGLLPVLPGAASLVDFTRPYRQDRFCVAGPAGVAVRSLDEVGERTLAVPAASFQLRWLQERQAEREQEGKAALQIDARPASSSIESLLVGMGEAGAPLTVALQSQLELWNKAAPQARTLFCGPESVPLAWAVRKDHPELLAELDRFLAAEGSKLIGRAIAQTRPYLEGSGKAARSAPLTGNDKLGLFAPAFKLAADATNMDWLLLAAIAQKETKFTHVVRTRGGPTGVMQVNPATARAMGVKDPHDTEQNVLAAGRYLDYLRKRFQRQGVSEADTLYFMIGAYNAGEGRLDQLRRQAKAQGLDPNRWVGHVEKVAHGSVGQRMVDYVSSVNRIYLAYQAADASRLRKDKRQASAAGSE
ncbi:transglycosylase SLT domain-containing protein [Chitinilyticum litopenaei]|uniref:transglycosylase SLT domain-containing protein n=1 Tax=Chitinilyticum litopenaei TaxID=1121276 RepID=UPI00041D0B96|nr:transglycosylase SLT domain-containing protein [Chitinilyticum litopenaei]